MKNIFKTTVFFTLILILVSSCGKDNYNKFEGTYDLKSSGNVNYFLDDTTFTDEPGLAVIKKGEKSDELFLYVETNFVTSIAPLGVYANASIDGNEYKIDPRSLNISIDFGGTPLSLPFTVNATGSLSKDKKTLTSTIEFTGGITGTLTSVGTKR